jgi:hypothetical protein
MELISKEKSERQDAEKQTQSASPGLTVTLSIVPVIFSHSWLDRLIEDVHSKARTRV